MQIIGNYRFIERDYWFHHVLKESEHISPLQIDPLLDESGEEWDDLTFKFYEDGTVIIIDNTVNMPIKPNSLTGASYDFYVRRRMELIRANLEEKILQLH